MCNVCEGGEGVPGKPNIRHNCYPLLDLHLTGYLFCFHFCLFAIAWAAPAAYGGSQARGRIGVIATSLHHSHSNAGSEPHLQPTLQLTATPDP